MPAFIVWSSNIGLPVIIAATTRTGAIPINLTSPWPQVVYAGPNVRLRGLTATTYPKLDLDDISFNWSAELRPDFSGPYLWSNLGLTNSNTFPRTERKIIAAQVNRIDQPLFAIDRSFDGEVHKTWIRKSPARLSALPVSLKLEELPRTAAGYGKHTLRVTNTGNIAVQSARLASTKLDSVRFSCSVNAGRCAPQAGEGTMNLELDLAPGASATVELFDALASSGNAVILMAPIDEIEDDVSDNTVGFGARFLSSGFEN